MNKSESATIAKVLTLLDGGLCGLDPLKDTRDPGRPFIRARRLLDDLLAPAKPRPLAYLKKNPTAAEIHAGPYCYCRKCLPVRKDEARAQEAAMIAAGTLSPTWRTDKRDRIESAPLESRESITARLEVCACGHRVHTADKLDNLLACETPGCDCDHFHYQSSEAATQVGNQAVTIIAPAAIPACDSAPAAIEPAEWAPADRAELARVNADMLQADDNEAFGRDAGW